MTKQEQAEIFMQGKQIHPKDTTASVFFGPRPQDQKDETAGAFVQEFSLEGLDPRIKKQKEVMAFDQRKFDKSADDFVGRGPDPRDKTAIDFLDW